MKKIALLVVAMAVAVAGLSLAQAKADFSGKWAPKEAAAPAGGGGRGGGMAGPITIKQTATELTQEQTMGENTMTSVYKLDGTDGGKLVIKTTMEGPNGATETTATWSLSADGKELTIVRATARGERTMVYTKQ